MTYCHKANIIEKLSQFMPLCGGRPQLNGIECIVRYLRCDGYINLCLPRLIEETKIAVKIHTMDKIFLTPVSLENEKRV